MSETGQGSARGLAAFAHRDFAAYWFGTLFGNLGFQMQSAALFWQVYDLTGSTLDLAFIGLAEFAPSLLLLAVTGPTADRVERRLIVQCGFAVQLVGALLLVAFTLAEPAEAGPFFVVAWLIGPVATVVLGGVATLAVCSLWIRWFPELYRVDRLDRRLTG